MARRYVLLQSDSDVDPVELGNFVKERFGEAKVIEVRGNPKFVILRTTERVAASLKESKDGLTVQQKRLVPVLTSGVVGKLKRRAAGPGANGQVHERGIRGAGPVGADPGSEVG